MHLMLEHGWSCLLLESDLKTCPGWGLRFADAAKIREMYDRFGGDKRARGSPGFGTWHRKWKGSVLAGIDRRTVQEAKRARRSTSRNIEIDQLESAIKTKTHYGFEMTDALGDYIHTKDAQMQQVDVSLQCWRLI
jgi:hypothetical protein